MSVGDDGWSDDASEIAGSDDADALSGGASGDTLQPAQRNPPLPTVGRGAKFLLGQISASEGTDARAAAHGYGSVYDVPYGYGAFDPPGRHKPLSQMTLDEVDRFQSAMKRGPDGKPNTPVGRYQIIQSTLRDLRQKYGLGGQTLYSPDLQDQLGRVLMAHRGYDDANLSAAQLQPLFSKEWGSIPGADGNVRKGQRQGMTTAAFQQYLTQARQMDAQR